MHILQVILYVIAIVLLILAGLRPLAVFRYFLCCFAAACALAAFALPTIAGGN